MGQSMRPIPWDQLRYSHDVDGYELNVTEDRLSVSMRRGPREYSLIL
jgi:hypothetical protein